MIQDVAPYKLDRTYRLDKPKEDDFALCFRGGRVLLLKKQDRLKIPRFRDLKDCGQLTQAPYYLFSMKKDGESDEFTRPASEEAREEREGMHFFLLDEAFLESVSETLGNEEKSGFSLEDMGVFRGFSPQHMAFAGITASQLYRWKRSRSFCGVCGTPTIPSSHERAFVCPKCAQIEYPKISPAIITAITDGDRLLMAQSKNSTYKRWALIAGFVEIGETFEDTVKREVMEEVGLHVKNIRYCRSQPWAFSDTEMVGFFADLDGEDTLTVQEEEIACAKWFERKDIPQNVSDISVATLLIERFRRKEHL